MASDDKIEETIKAIAARHGIAEAIWPVEPYDPFFNANRPEDLAEAEAILGRHPEA